MSFDIKQKYYLQNPDRFGQDVSQDSDDPALLGDGSADLTDDTQGPSALERADNAVSDVREKMDDYKDWRKRNQDIAKKPQVGDAPTAKPKGVNPGGAARTGAAGAGEAAAGTGAGVAEAAAGTAAKAAAGGAARTAAGAGVAAAGAAEAVTGPAGWAVAALALGAELVKTKPVKYALLIIFILFICIIIAIGAGLGLFSRSGTPGSSPHIPGTSAHAGTITTKAQSVATFVENIDAITRDTEDLLALSPKLASKSAQIKALLTQLRELRPQIEPTASSGGQATAEQLQKYAALVLQIKQLVDSDRKPLSDQVIARTVAVAGSSTVALRLDNSMCKTERDIKNLSVTSSTMKVLLAAADYGAAKGKTIQVNCLVSGHRKYVGMKPSDGYPYCGQPETAKSRTFSPSQQSAHCSGRAIDFQGIDSGLVAYLKSRKGALSIEDILVETDHPHVHIELLP